MARNRSMSKFRREMPWFIISVLLTLLGSISIILLFVVFYIIDHEIIFWCIQISWITVLIIGAVEISRQEAARRQIEDELHYQFKEKHYLMSKMYQRIKENMQVISSMIQVQNEYNLDKLSIENLKSTGNMESLVLLHERLYCEADLSHLDFKDYVETIVSKLYLKYDIDPEIIQRNIDIKFSLLNFDYAVPCGLIINELISNSLRHAFPPKRKGNIFISLDTDAKDNYILTIADDGRGLPPKIDFRQSRTFGLQMVNILIDQLFSVVEINRTKGTEIKITFQRHRKR
ncbi:MAG: hypothetical protein DRH79_02915 [Candidatus Cloacimonadota bacterium]|nr:MAG: hypothetical protein DRH79_02915 [Candidatus Cloacimonadota bacterium]